MHQFFDKILLLLLCVFFFIPSTVSFRYCFRSYVYFFWYVSYFCLLYEYVVILLVHNNYFKYSFINRRIIIYIFYINLGVSLSQNIIRTKRVHLYARKLTLYSHAIYTCTYQFIWTGNGKMCIFICSHNFT